MPDYAKLAALRSEQWFAFEPGDEKTIIRIDGIVGETFWSDESVTAKAFIEQLSQVRTQSVELHINSVGGDVDDGRAIYNSLVAWSHAVPGRAIDVIVDGMAASIASVIAMSGDTISMPQSSTMMIHRPWTLAMGNDIDLAKSVDYLKLLNVQLAKIYSDRTGLDAERVLEMMTAETYMSPDSALELGFATDVLENKKAVACAFCAEIYGGATPSDCLKLNQSSSKRVLERSLRDAGYSGKQARAIAAGPCDGDDGECSEQVLHEIEQLTEKMKLGGM